MRLDKTSREAHLSEIIESPECRVHFGQFGEDAMLAEFMKNRANGFYVDIGCHDPQRFSNTFLLWKVLGWQGINIDADPHAIERFKVARPNDINLHFGVGPAEGYLELFMFSEGAVNTFDSVIASSRQQKFGAFETVKVPIKTLKSILDEYLPRNQAIDYMNVNVEGLDFEVLKSNDWVRYRPQYLSVELHGIDLRRAGDNPVVQYLETVGYKLISFYWVTGLFERMARYIEARRPSRAIIDSARKKIAEIKYLKHSLKIPVAYQAIMTPHGTNAHVKGTLTNVSHVDWPVEIEDGIRLEVRAEVFALDGRKLTTNFQPIDGNVVGAGQQIAFDIELATSGLSPQATSCIVDLCYSHAMWFHHRPENAALKFVLVIRAQRPPNVDAGAPDESEDAPTGDQAGTGYDTGDDDWFAKGGSGSVLASENLLGIKTAARGEAELLRLDESRAIAAFFDPDRHPPSPLKELIETYLLGGAAANHTLRKGMRSRIESAIKTQNPHLASEGVFEDNFHIKESIVKEYAPSMRDQLFAQAPDVSLERYELLPDTLNENYDCYMPKPLTESFSRQRRPRLNLFGAQNATAYVHPYYYQVYDSDGRWAWRDASPRALSRHIQSEETSTHEGDLVIVQDYFDGANFSHFLFDHVTRAGHFMRHAGSKGAAATFVFGGVPGKFQELTLKAFCSAFDVPRENIFFPRRGINLKTSGVVYWFSDQVQRPMHPAQLMNKLSIEIIRDIGSRLHHTQMGQLPRIYISRSDANTRRIVNEERIVRALEHHGFKSIALSDLPMQAQMQMMSTAEVIVAPHGMGLTHLAFHRGAPRVVELFNPNYGTGAYALLAKAYGMTYKAVIGKEETHVTRDYQIDVDQLMSVVEPLL